MRITADAFILETLEPGVEVEIRKQDLETAMRLWGLNFLVGAGGVYAIVRGSSNKRTIRDYIALRIAWQAPQQEDEVATTVYGAYDDQRGLYFCSSLYKGKTESIPKAVIAALRV